MCDRFTLKTSPARIAKLLGLKSVPAFEPRYNIAPSQPVLAVRLEPERGEREATFLKWGLIPSWAKESGIGNKLANARADTVAEKPAFRSAFKKRRCLVLADGFYEFIWTIFIPLPLPRGRGPTHRTQRMGLLGSSASGSPSSASNCSPRRAAMPLLLATPPRPKPRRVLPRRHELGTVQVQVALAQSLLWQA
jgi:hypothetical protein